MGVLEGGEQREAKRLLFGDPVEPLGGRLSFPGGDGIVVGGVAVNKRIPHRQMPHGETVEVRGEAVEADRCHSADRTRERSGSRTSIAADVDERELPVDVAPILRNVHPYFVPLIEQIGAGHRVVGEQGYAVRVDTDDPGQVVTNLDVPFAHRAGRTNPHDRAESRVGGIQPVQPFHCPLGGGAGGRWNDPSHSRQQGARRGEHGQRIGRDQSVVGRPVHLGEL